MIRRRPPGSTAAVNRLPAEGPAVAGRTALRATATARCTSFAMLSLAVAASLLPVASPSLAAAPEPPEVLQARGVQGVDHFIDHFRKTGDHASLLAELRVSEIALAASYD